MNQNDERDFYTVPEAARVLDVSQATIWRWIEARRLPAYRVGPRRIRIKKQDLEVVVQPIRAGEVVAMSKEKAPRAGIWANYDARRVREALRKSAGALADLDRQELLADLRAARRQSSAGRPD